MTTPADDSVPFPPPPPGDLHGRLLDAVSEIGELRARVEQVERDRDEGKDTIRRLTELGPVVQHLSATVETSSLGPALSARENDDESAAASWCWITMAPDEQAEAILQLARWMEDVVWARYPKRVKNVRPCWPLHPTALEELGWLYGEWRMAYLDPEGVHRLAGEWHDRWLDGVLQRFGRDREFDACEQDHKAELAFAVEHGAASIPISIARQLKDKQHEANQQR